MGIKGLSKLLLENCPKAIKEQNISNYYSRIVAIDGNMSMYQFLIGVRGSGQDLENQDGKITSHLQGILYRTTRLLEAGIKPVYVFDGKPPELKYSELEKRKLKTEQAQEEMEDADEERKIQMSKRTIRVSKEQIEEAKVLLQLLGIPVIQAPSEAEAQCCELVKGNLAYAIGTEDMDALTFGSKILLRHLNFSEARKEPILEFNLEKILSELKLNQEQFIDLCILCGCDYTDTIKGIGPKRALKLIQEHQTIENILPHLTKKNVVPDHFPISEVRNLFLKPDVIPCSEIKLNWNEVNQQELLSYLVNEKQFDEQKVKKVIERIKVARKKMGQQRIDSFFKKKVM
jgi:flap endonuclease-1